MVDERENRSVSHWTQKTLGQLNSRQEAQEQRHFSFKDAKCSLRHVGRPCNIPVPRYSVPIVTSQVPSWKDVGLTLEKP